jgi:uncharacterized protein YndB with AHSA1/START domain
MEKENKSFEATIEVSKTPQRVFNCITNDVTKWWGGKDLEGSSKKLNDEFVINHPGAHYSKQKLIEVIPGKKIVWLVTDSTLHWLKNNQHEWTDTKMIFEITTGGDARRIEQTPGRETILHFTHQGLVPGMECYSMCEQGWTTVIKDYLFNLIEYDTAHF